MLEARPITPEIAARNALYAMLCCNVYHDKSRPRFPVERLGWQQVDLEGFPSNSPTRESKITGFAYDIYEHDNSNKAVIAFRGTDSLSDWVAANIVVPFSIPYKQAFKAVRTYLRNNANKNLAIVGHSLGGGMALGASARFGVPAYTFNTSPRIFDGIGDYHEEALRVVIYQEGDILTEVRKRWKKLHEVVKPEDTYVCTYDTKGENAHRIDLLARNILEHGATVDSRLKSILSAL